MKWKTIFLILLLISPSFLFLLPKVEAQSDWWNSSFQYRTELSFDYTKIDANQTEFPVLVHLNSSRVNWKAIQDDLSDLRFIQNNVSVPHEVESYTANSEAWIWVKTNTSIPLYMYYDNPLALSIENKTAVWDSNFLMIQHLKDNSTSTTLDSTSYANNGVKKDVDEPIEIDGKIGKAQSFDGTNDYIGLASSVDASTTSTISFWVNTDDLTKLAALVGEASYLYSYVLYYDSGTLYFRVDTIAVWWSSIGISTNTWYQFVITRDGNNCHFFLNTLDKGLKTGVILVNTKINTIGGRGDRPPTDTSKGIYDEFQYSDIVRSDSWIEMSYYSESDQLLTFGSEESYVPPVVPPTSFPPYAYVAIILAVAALAFVVTEEHKKK